jgi:hypothetical protein
MLTDTQSHQLPLDVLRNIFEIAANDIGFALKISAVCACWRQLAHATPYIWAIVDGSYPKLIKIQLALSRDVPLSVRFNKWGFKEKDRKAAAAAIIETVTHQKHRIRSFSIDSPCELTDDVMTIWSKCKLPTLERLVVTRSYYDRAKPNPGLNFEAPQLWALYMTEVPVASNSPIWSPSIRELTVEFDETWGSRQRRGDWTINKWKRVLASLSCLELLSIKATLRSEWGPDPRDDNAGKSGNNDEPDDS